MELNLNGKVAIVTGAGLGIGVAIASELACEQGLVPLVRDSVRLKQAADELKKTANVGVRIVAADLSDPAVPARAVADVVATFGSLDLLVNNAGAKKRAKSSPLRKKIGKRVSR